MLTLASCRWTRLAFVGCAAAVVAPGVAELSLAGQTGRAGVTRLPPADDGESAWVTVQIRDTKRPEGSAGVALWAAAQGFPESIEHALETVYVPIDDGVASAVFEGLEPGAYAVTVYNDRNGNREFDKNWIGMPKESWGVSNDARPRLRAPRFDEAVFELTTGPNKVTIEIR